MRLFFALRIPVVEGDSLVYANITDTLLRHGIYGLTDTNVHATLIRLPGYPLFLAAIFRLFGQDNFTAVMLVQVLFDLGTCFLVAELARRAINERAAVIAFAIAALCPFTANYSGTPLTETLSIFFTAAAFLFAAIAFEERRNSMWMWCGVSVSCTILLRPDGGILMGAIGLAMIWRFARVAAERKHMIVAGVLLVVFSFLPLVPWTIRNWRTFHVFQPLVKADATDPGEWDPHGWNHWFNTWLIDYSSVEDVGWHIDGEPVRFEDIPSYAFWSPDEKQQVSQLIAAYNAADNTMTRELDAQFGAIADRHEREHPLRVKLLFPAGRLISTWLRPRTEMLPIDTHFWRWEDDPHDSSIAIALGLLNLALIAVAAIGLFKGVPAKWLWLSPLLIYIVVRSLFLARIGAAEPRYVLECFPGVFVFASRYLAKFRAG